MRVFADQMPCYAIIHRRGYFGPVGSIYGTNRRLSLKHGYEAYLAGLDYPEIQKATSIWIRRGHVPTSAECPVLALRL